MIVKPQGLMKKGLTLEEIIAKKIESIARKVLEEYFAKDVPVLKRTENQKKCIESFKTD
jgi:hypothetical protein